MVATKPPRRGSSTNSPPSGRRPPPPAEVAQFQRFCAELRVEDGSPLLLYPEELEILGPYFEGATETVILLTKKNGKSTLIAALALYHLLSTPFANCIIVAAARDQAQLIMDQARPMIRQSAALQKHVRARLREIVSLIDGGKIRVLASDEDTADGQLPSLAIVDELHRHKTSDLYGVLHDGLDARQGQMITISTAGASTASPLGEIRRKAYEMPGFVRDKERRTSTVRSEDGSFAFFEWCLNSDDDPDDLKLVKIVNPAPWQTIDRLKRRKESPSMTPWRWLRFACGIWTEGEEPGIDPQLWDPLGVLGLDIPEGSGDVMCVDVAERGESTAIALVMADGDSYTVKVEYFRTTTTKAQVEARVRELYVHHPVREIVYDTQAFGRSAELLLEEGLPMLEFPQSNERMVQASATLHKLMEEGRLHHDGDPELRAQAMAVRVKDTERGWRYAKTLNSPAPVDGLFALMIALHRAETESPGEPLFSFR
jgi:phage terminase large subunit-like protein